MRRPLHGSPAGITAGVLFVTALLLSPPASADGDNPYPDNNCARLFNADFIRRLQSPGARAAVAAAAESVWVGYSPAYAGSNYWSVGVGPNRPGAQVGGNWDWEHPVHGD